jgi:transcriptional regulator with XRE-family HTH domain
MMVDEKRVYSRSKVMPKPDVVVTAEQRGQALQHFVDLNNTTMMEFATKSGISYSALTKYAKGSTDLATIQQRTAERLITAMELSDTEAWEYFNIPEDRRAQFRTFRPPPLGHGEAPRSILSLTLPAPLTGTLSAPAGYIVQYNPARRLNGLMLAEAPDGQYFALDAGLVRGNSRILGEIVSVHVHK